MQRILQVVLTAWRDAERVAGERSLESREHEAALVAAEHLRGLYAELVESAKAENDDAVLKTVQPLETGEP